MKDPKKAAELARKQKEAEELAKIEMIPRFMPVVEKPDLTAQQFEENIEFASVLDGMPSFEDFDEFGKAHEEAGEALKLLKSEYHKIGYLSFSQLTKDGTLKVERNEDNSEIIKLETHQVQTDETWNKKDEKQENALSISSAFQATSELGDDKSQTAKNTSKKNTKNINVIDSDDDEGIIAEFKLVIHG